MVPEGWKITTVEELFDIQLGKMLNKRAKEQKPQLPYLTNFNIRWGYIVFSSLNAMFFSDREKEKFSLKKNDLLLCEGGEVGRCAIWRDEYPVCYYQKALHRLRPRGGMLSAFFQLFMEFISGSKLLEDFTSRTSIAHLTKEKLSMLPVKVPPLPEQKKIAAILSTWDEAIVTMEQLLSNSRQQKKALAQQLLSGKKRLPGFEGEWKSVRIGSLLKEKKRPVTWDDNDEYKLISVKRRGGGVFLREILKGSKIKTKNLMETREGDFVISKMQVVHGATGYISKRFHRNHISGSYIALIPKNPAKLNNEFISLIHTQRTMQHKAFLCSYGVHIEKMTFNLKLFFREKIRIPDNIEEQTSIVSVLTLADQEITTLEQKLDRLKQEKKALMQQLLTGKRRVKLTE